MVSSSVPDFYGRWAPLYDVLATFPGVDRWRARVADALALSPGDTVVDVGCGTGATLPHLRERVGPSGRVVGVDVTRPLLARARERADRWDNVHVVHGDATVLPLESGAPDAVLATFLVGLLADPADAVADWCDLVGPGGRVALLDATSSGRPAGRLLNPPFRAFVAAGAPSSSPGDVVRALAPGSLADESLTERVRASRAALADRTVDRRFESFGLGFLGIARGRVA